MKLANYLLISTLLLTGWISGSHAGQEVWKFASLNWQPYSGETLEAGGESVQVLTQSLAKHGIKVVVEYYPWLRAQHQASYSSYVGYFPAWPEEVGKGFTASAAIDWSEISIVQNADIKLETQNLEQLAQQYTIGLIRTYIYPKVIRDLQAKYPQSFDISPDELSIVKKISNGRLQLAITDYSVAAHIAETQNLENIKHGFSIMKKELVIAVRNGADNKNKLELINSIFQGK